MLLYRFGVQRYIRMSIYKYLPGFKKTQSQPQSSQTTNTGDPENNEFGKKFLNTPLDEKRKLYRNPTYVTPNDGSLVQWQALCKFGYRGIKTGEMQRNDDVFKFTSDDEINSKICLWQGDVTRLEIDAIVNAANRTLLGGGGVDGSIHRGAGPSLVKECELLNGCHTGESKITSGHRLPAKFVIHSVGPVGKNSMLLQGCYQSILQLVLKHNIRTVAFVCISTGIYGYPNLDAAHVALATVRNWMNQHHSKVDKIIFCTFLNKDFEIYYDLMKSYYFPCEYQPVEDSSGEISETSTAVENDELEDAKRPNENENLNDSDEIDEKQKKQKKAEETDSCFDEDDNLKTELKTDQGPKPIEHEEPVTDQGPKSTEHEEPVTDQGPKPTEHEEPVDPEIGSDTDNLLENVVNEKEDLDVLKLPDVPLDPPS